MSQANGQIETPRTPNSLNPTGGHRIRRSSASRGISAATSEAFPIPLSPSPIIKPLSDACVGLSKPPVIRAAADTAAALSRITPDSPSRIAALQRALEGAKSRKEPLDGKLKTLASGVAQLILQYVGSDFRAIRAASHICRRFYWASFAVVSRTTLIPDETSLARLSTVCALSSLAQFLSAATRGQYLTSLTVIEPHSVYALPQTVKGPSCTVQGLTSLLINLPHLTELDVRGIDFRSTASWCGYFLPDLPQCCPRLQVLRCGAHLIKTWEAQWWASLTSLKELVVGSRREAADWVSNAPLQLQDDFFVMLKTLSSLKVVKIWCPLTSASFAQVFTPPFVLPHITHLSVNAAGNAVNYKPNEEAVKEEAVSNKKVDAKNVRKAEDSPQVPKLAYPVLVSVAIADVKDRPELAPELMCKLSVSAPQLRFCSFVNTHRNAPGEQPPAPPAKPQRGAKPPANISAPPTTPPV